MPAVLLFQAVLAVVHSGSCKVSGALGQGEDAALLNRVFPEQVTLAEPDWHELPLFLKPQGGTEALSGHSQPGRGRRVAKGVTS